MGGSTQIDVCILWHMHQPFYKDLVRGEYKLPWTRMHGLKDYYGMVRILEEFPKVHQTFNLVPSMLAQVEEYASGTAADPFLRLALRPAEELTGAEREFLIRYFFQANTDHLIHRYPRYAELYHKRHQPWETQDYRDLQVLSQLAWFDEFFLAGNALARKGRGFTLDDQAEMGRQQLEILGKVLPVYREYASSGQIEISTTPFYHPILPLVCDSDIAGIANPHVPLPTRFHYPADASEQLRRARDYVRGRLGVDARGLWPSEGSVSDQALELAADCGFAWFATDNGVLSRTLGREAGVAQTYRPWEWRHNGRSMKGVFRDHYLSDLVGFTYSKMGAEEAADHLMARILENAAGRDALVPVILDGENAWEYFPESGREFLRQLYQRLSDTPGVRALTISEALERHEAPVLNGIFPGSWISANFDVWIGFDEDNLAWEHLRRAREAFDKHSDKASKADRALAYEELLIAEGSDWCWWYGPHHHTDNRVEFDQLYRDHLSNVYRLLGLAPPPDLSRPVLKSEVTAHHVPPGAEILPTLDGEVTSYFEWMGAGEYAVDSRQGAMHGARSGMEMLRYGAGGGNLYLRLDFDPIPEWANLELRVTTAAGEIRLSGASLATGKVVEAMVPLPPDGTAVLAFQLAVWLDGIPVEQLPTEGWLSVEVPGANWSV